MPRSLRPGWLRKARTEPRSELPRPARRGSSLAKREATVESSLMPGCRAPARFRPPVRRWRGTMPPNAPGIPGDASGADLEPRLHPTLEAAAMRPRPPRIGTEPAPSRSLARSFRWACASAARPFLVYGGCNRPLLPAVSRFRNAFRAGGAGSDGRAMKRKQGRPVHRSTDRWATPLYTGIRGSRHARLRFPKSCTPIPGRRQRTAGLDRVRPGRFRNGSRPGVVR